MENDLKSRVEKLENSYQDLNGKKNRLDGQYSSIIEQLKQLGCDSIEDANKLVGKLRSDLEEDNKTLLSKIEELEVHFGMR